MTTYLTRNHWLTQPSLFKLSQSISQTLRLPTLYAQRPDLLTLQNHAKLHHGQTYRLEGYISNPQVIPLTAPNIELLIVDRDNQITARQQYAPPQWQAFNSDTAIAAHTAAKFQLTLETWPQESWGYRLKLH